MKLSARLSLASLFLLLLSPPALAGQTLLGRVLEHETGAGVAGARVLLVPEGGGAPTSVTSDSAGHFRLVAPLPGSYRLEAERIGYSRTRTEGIELAAGEVVEVQLVLGAEPLPIAPVHVVGRRRLAAGIRGFHDRMEQRRKAGMGRFLTAEDIRGMNAFRISAVLQQVPEMHVMHLGPQQARGMALTQVRMRLRGRLCTPRTFIDGAEVRIEYFGVDQLLDPDGIEGIEIYRDPNEAPGTYADRSGCGSLLLWTRTTAEPTTGLRWWRHLVGGVGALLLLIVASQSL